MRFNIDDIENDIIGFVINIFKKKNTNALYFKKWYFWNEFIKKYPLKYQVYDDKFIVTHDILLEIVRNMEIASPFKFMKHNAKRYKFTISRIKNYAKK